jgi:hypothetical protein
MRLPLSEVDVFYFITKMHLYCEMVKRKKGFTGSYEV